MPQESFCCRVSHRIAASLRRYSHWLDRLRTRLRDKCLDSTLVRRHLRPRLGERGESAAARFLRRRHFQIVARQVRDVFGEIDLVAVDGRTVVFVEVKTRRHMTVGEALSSVTPEKQRRISRSALRFMRRNDLLECAARFDVVAVIWPRQQRRPEIVHIPNAFEIRGYESMFG